MMKLPAKMETVLLWLLAAMLTIYSVSLVFRSNFNLGNLMVWLLTLAVVVYAVWQKQIHVWFSTGFGRVVLWVLVLLAAVYLGLIVFVAVSGHTVTYTGQERAVIVLGAGLRGDKPSNLLKDRLNTAYDYAASHPDTLVITTGGQGRDEWVPEGQAMRDYLLAKGLPADRVLAETKSTSTEENFMFALAILRERGLDESTPVLYVTNAFHCYRAGCYAREAGFEQVGALAAPTPPTSVLQCYLREALALCYYWVFKTSTSGPMHAMVGLLNMNKQFFYRR